MFCTNCGKELNKEAVVCTGCGVPTSNYNKKETKSKEDDKPSGGYNALAFFFPIVGIILGAVWNSEYPVRSKQIIKWSIIGFVVPIVVWIIFMILIPIIFYSTNSTISNTSSRAECLSEGGEWRNSTCYYDYEGWY